MSNRAKTLQNLYKRHKVTIEGLRKAFNVSDNDGNAANEKTSSFIVDTVPL